MREEIDTAVDSYVTSSLQSHLAGPCTRPPRASVANWDTTSKAGTHTEPLTAFGMTCRLQLTCHNSRSSSFTVAALPTLQRHFHLRHMLSQIVSTLQANVGRLSLARRNYEEREPTSTISQTTSVRPGWTHVAHAFNYKMFPS